ncbi:hypothetical protein PA10_00088 [Pseudomonas phage pPa_SNUABM_DT01]|nr:hypothetical protein PA10_00088 [Pseudomonas phage pPa_SNUABM_DT01]
MSTDIQAKHPANAPFDPAEDGKTHINVYSRGATAFGRSLSNLADCNIEHPYFGHFRTLEGLWFWMKTGQKDDSFRIIKGLAARDLGKSMESSHYPLFSKMFKLGMLEKLERSPQLQRELVENELPLAHYYVYGKKQIMQDRHQWQLDFWLLLRAALKTTGNLDTIRAELVDSIKYHLDNQAQEDKANGPGTPAQ